MAALTVVRVETAQIHDRRVLRFEAKESLKAAELIVKDYPKAQEWLQKNRRLWR